VEFEIVRVAEDLADRAVFDGVDELRAFAEAGSEDSMSGVGLGFRAGVDGESDGCGAATQAFELGEDEPHPVGLFLAGAEFGEDLGVDQRLGVEEALEVVWVVHSCSRVRGRHRSRAAGTRPPFVRTG